MCPHDAFKKYTYFTSYFNNIIIYISTLNKKYKTQYNINISILNICFPTADKVFIFVYINRNILILNTCFPSVVG